MSSSRLKIAMVGQRGVPATYGGIEHHVVDGTVRLEHHRRGIGGGGGGGCDQGRKDRRGYRCDGVHAGWHRLVLHGAATLRGVDASHSIRMGHLLKGQTAPTGLYARDPRSRLAP